ncbi:MAG: lysylphosphatidylglycerol synthase transmembrane domain-containing protein [Candidatus Binatia bacterium]
MKLTISLALLAAILWQLGGLYDVMRAVARIDPWYVFLVLLVNTGDRALMSYKWSQLLRSRHMRLPLLRAMMIYCSSMVWGLLLPTTVGADVIRAASASRSGLDSTEVVSSIVIERMIGFLSAILLGLLGLLLLSSADSLDPRLDFAWLFGGIMLVASAAAFALSFNQRSFECLGAYLPARVREGRVLQRLRRFHSTYRAYQRNKRALAIFFLLTFAEQLLPIVHAWLIAVALGVDVSLFYIAGALPLSILISRIPVSIDGLGVFESVFILLLSFVGVSSSEAFAIALAGRILQTVSWLPWWLAHAFAIGELKIPRTAKGAGIRTQE